MPAIRIGIDVGGTFTHAVALDGSTHKILGHSLVPTTHFAKEGPALGIVGSLKALLNGPSIKTGDITFIAHSTTQATNALLEGDVADVGIIGIGGGFEARKVKAETNLGTIELNGGGKIETVYEFIDSKSDLGAQARDRVKRLKEKRAKTIVAAAAYSVDDPSSENIVAQASASEGLPAVSTHDLSGLYGLRARTRTAVVNASILPKMLEAACMTEAAVGGCGIKASLMVMRSDGGVLSLNEVKKRPILTMLSGPAAGVAAALMYEKISDGIFLEVGGTSTDITVIKDGKALVRSAQVGGNKLYLKTLDVRTVGLAGGSMPRISGGRVMDVGPRSAHIAGLRYSSFSKKEDIIGSKPLFFSPKDGDRGDYAALLSQNGEKYAVTVTCAANALGLVPEGDWARGDGEAAREAIGILAKELNKNADKAAREILDVSCGRFVPIIEALIKEYGLDRKSVILVGGGGGASAIVPYLAKKMGLEHRIAKNNAIISAIGAALALLHEEVERSVIDPSEEDIMKIRREAQAMILAMGARPETVEVEIEVDGRKNILRASAFGATELRVKLEGQEATLERKTEIAAKSMGISAQNVKLVAEVPGFSVFCGEVILKRLFGLLVEKKIRVRAVDSEGVIRLQRESASVKKSVAGDLLDDLKDVIAAGTRYGDAGERLPGIFILVGGKILDLSHLADAAQVLLLAALEKEGLPKTEPVIIISSV